MPRLTFFLVLCFMPLFVWAQSPTRQAYIAKYQKIAIEEMERAGIPASIKLAQGILESGDGKSSLAVQANNHFGMKCGSSWTGPTYYLKDDDFDANGNLIKSCFRKYPNPEYSYRAHTDFLTDPKKAYRYGSLFDLDATDYKAWAHGLKKAGYATNPKYADLLIGIIEANELYRYDRMSTEIPAAVSEARLVNQIRAIVVGPNETMASLARKYEVPLKRLLKYNDLKRDRPVPEGQYVFLQAKRKKSRGREKYHTVKAGEEMYSISQKYGIKLLPLYKKNRLNVGQEVRAGEKVSLKKKVKSAPRLRSKTAPVKPNPGNTNNPPTNKPKIHKVISGDTLYSIARQYNLTVAQLKKMNNLSSDIIRLGQELRVR